MTPHMTPHMTLCSKPGCGGAGAAVLSYSYADRVARLEDPQEGLLSPHVYVLCDGCANKISPPRGWSLDDQRTTPPLFVSRLEDHRAASATGAVSDEPAADGSFEGFSRQLFFGSSA